MHLSDGGLEIEEGDAEDKECDEVGDEEDSPSIFVDEVGEAPEGAEPHSEAYH